MSSKLNSKKVLVIGSGLSGISAIKLLLNVNAIPYLYDKNKTDLPPDLNIPTYIGTLPPSDILDQLDLAVISPGISLENPEVMELISAGIPIISEIELAYINSKGRIIAITGTNGKTTTVSLVGEIMKAHFAEVFVVGNIGHPFSEIALQTTDNSVIVIEVSSFQLETIKDFTPHISAILNITPDHLDRHGTMENYVAMKEKITQNQTQENYCILNLENEYTASFAKRCKAKVVGFSSEREINNGCYLRDNTIYFHENETHQPIIKTTDTKLVGISNIENIMAAILIALKMNTPTETIKTAVQNFRAVEHRLEYVATHNGVEYYNDSKATNPDAAIQGIRAMTKPTILIAGGSDKKADYIPWLSECRHQVKSLILLGETQKNIAECAIKIGINNIYEVKSLNEAVALTKEIAVNGEAVLLSPACASLDMFQNYEARGKKFKELVENINSKDRPLKDVVT